MGPVIGPFYAQAVNGSTVGDRSGPKRRTYALSEGLAGRTASGAVWRVLGPHIAHVRVVATRRSGKRWRSRPDRGGRKRSVFRPPRSGLLRHVLPHLLVAGTRTCVM